ncbi:TPA: hypothetical protein ACXPD2_000164 [Klebsiella pneumoniae]|uniref:hypothetical protein n=1 Tax=Klebsiella pneumoniae TaxID=573 RepID=UPI00164665C3|nr:hypothetical protein [Klebsiella pneumoniae]EKW2891622.1 hypothetical protein [Klebsiella pneumoniae]ELA0627881.1 hypothetical protein [Klebsiella pneumoniae]MBC4125413.1 hypothetical protein [Klebsiella pneumoniae]MBX4703652.1 hypothetical protein [Klebsiella pneumoniae]MCD9656173.1 hypothetical protein [Klebsiella pneumoniae]
MMNKDAIYGAALARWGFDAQALVLAKECNALSADVSRMLLHRPHNMVQECADVEIMIEQMRHGGMSTVIDREKERRLARLALLVEGCKDLDIQEPAAILRKDAHDIEYGACDDYAELQAAMMECNYRLAERYARKTASRLLHLAQILGRLARINPGDLDEGGVA